LEPYRDLRRLELAVLLHNILAMLLHLALQLFLLRSQCYLLVVLNSEMLHRLSRKALLLLFDFTELLGRPLVCGSLEVS